MCGFVAIILNVIEAKALPPAQEAFVGQSVSNDDINTPNRPLKQCSTFTN